MKLIRKISILLLSILTIVGLNCNSVLAQEQSPTITSDLLEIDSDTGEVIDNSNARLTVIGNKGSLTLTYNPGGSSIYWKVRCTTMDYFSGILYVEDANTGKTLMYPVYGEGSGSASDTQKISVTKGKYYNVWLDGYAYNIYGKAVAKTAEHNLSIRAGYNS